MSAAPQCPQRAMPASSVGVLTRRGALRFGARLWSRAWTALNISSSTIAGTFTATHSDGGCQSACKRDPLSARKRDPLTRWRRVDRTRALALPAALGGRSPTGGARSATHLLLAGDRNSVV